VTSYFLDANHASPLVTAHHPLRRRIEAAKASGDSFALVAPVVTEVVFGLLTLPRAGSNQREWERLRPGFRVYPVDADVAWDAAMLQASLRRQGRQLATVDALTAVVALREGLTLLTTDGDFSAVPDLRTENWLVPPT
jgi:tRNA(fMet)-specific endonuclease VapC